MLLMPYNKDSYDECGTNSLFQRVNKCESEARRASRILPRVDANGNSECPFADKLYEEAEAWLDELKEQLHQLDDHVAGAEAAMERALRFEQEIIADNDPRDDGHHAREDFDRHCAARERIERKASETRRAIREIQAEIDARRES